MKFGLLLGLKVTMVTRMLSILVLLFVGAVAGGHQSGEPGCTAPYLLPNKPFFVVWNIPSHGCDAAGIKLNFSKYGIVSNQDDDWFGKSSVLFYGLGAFPYLNKSGAPINGGLPQLANLTLHFNKVVTDITSQVDPNFDGVGIIDMESWRPIFSENFDSLSIYQRESIALVKKEHPDWNKTQLYAEAARQFEIGARTLMEGTVNLAKVLRPLGHWGYYHFPYCFGVDKDNSSLCGNIATDDEMGWLWKASSGLYPSVYLYNPDKTPASAKRSYILRSFMETLRVSAKFSDPDTPIFMYSFVQKGALTFFNLTDLGFAIGEPAELGASGVLIWGSSGAFHRRGECQALQSYLDSTLGPYTKSVTDFAFSCAQKLCHFNGRCVRNDYDLWYQTQAVLAGRGGECGGGRWDGILGSTSKADITAELLLDMARQVESKELLRKLSLVRMGDALSLPELLRRSEAELKLGLHTVKDAFHPSLGSMEVNSVLENKGLKQKGQGVVLDSLPDVKGILEGRIFEKMSIQGEEFGAGASEGEGGDKAWGSSKYSGYSCRCLFGWHGADCSQRG